MENNKIGITAEFVSIIRSKDDPKNLYFISPKVQRIYSFIKILISEDKFKEIFDWRLKLSQIINQKILTDNPEQIIEFGCGYSLRGFNLCLENKNLVYIDSDLDDIICKKKKIINIICKKENIKFPENYHLVSIDVLKNEIFEKTKDIISSEKKTLALAEGLTSYFNDVEFETFLKNVRGFLDHFPNSEFYSNESISNPKGFIYPVLRYFISLITKTKGHNKFKTASEFEEYLRKINITGIKIDISKRGFLFYSLIRD